MMWNSERETKTIDAMQIGGEGRQRREKRDRHIAEETFSMVATADHRVGSGLAIIAAASRAANVVHPQHILGAPLVCFVILPPPARGVRAKARHAIWQVRVFHDVSVALCVDASLFFNDAQWESDAVHDRRANQGAWCVRRRGRRARG